MRRSKLLMTNFFNSALVSGVMPRWLYTFTISALGNIRVAAFAYPSSCRFAFLTSPCPFLTSPCQVHGWGKKARDGVRAADRRLRREGRTAHVSVELGLEHVHHLRISERHKKRAVRDGPLRLPVSLHAGRRHPRRGRELRIRKLDYGTFPILLLQLGLERRCGL